MLLERAQGAVEPVFRCHTAGAVALIGGTVVVPEHDDDASQDTEARDGKGKGTQGACELFDRRHIGSPSGFRSRAISTFGARTERA